MRVYSDFLKVVGLTVQPDGWYSPDSLGAYLALRVDADSYCISGARAFGGIQYIRNREAEGGVVLRENPVGNRGEAPDWLTMMLIGLNLRRFAERGRVRGSLIRASVEQDPMLDVRDGAFIDLEMAPISAVAMMRGIVPSPSKHAAVGELMNLEVS